MNSTASLTGMEYFSSVSNSSRKIAVALHWMFLGNRCAALADDVKNAKIGSKIKKHNLFPLKYWRDIFSSISCDSLASPYLLQCFDALFKLPRVRGGSSLWLK